MLRAIQEIKPRFVIAENVFGITNIDGGLVFEQVCLDLETEGYEVQPFIICAAAKNAPHRRDRCWFIAYANCNDGRSTDRESGCEESETNGEGEQSIHSRIGATSNEGITTNSKSNGSSIGKLGESESKQQVQTGSDIDGFESLGNATNTNGNGFNECNGNDEINTSQRGEYALGDINTSNVNGYAPNTTGIRRTQRGKNLQSKESNGFRFIRNGRKRNASNTNGIRSVQRNSNLIGKLSERNGFETLCQPTNWQNFPTQSPICGGDDGLPTQLDGITFSKWRGESIKGYGNAIVPQIAYQLFEIINEL
jgi:DNA (cytosine-5)-methyltransferase 1